MAFEIKVPANCVRKNSKIITTTSPQNGGRCDFVFFSFEGAVVLSVEGAVVLSPEDVFWLFECSVLTVVFSILFSADGVAFDSSRDLLFCSCCIVDICCLSDKVNHFSPTFVLFNLISLNLSDYIRLFSVRCLFTERSRKAIAGRVGWNLKLID